MVPEDKRFTLQVGEEKVPMPFGTGGNVYNPTQIVQIYQGLFLGTKTIGDRVVAIIGFEGGHTGRYTTAWDMGSIPSGVTLWLNHLPNNQFEGSTGGTSEEVPIADLPIKLSNIVGKSVILASYTNKMDASRLDPNKPSDKKVLLTLKYGDSQLRVAQALYEYVFNMRSQTQLKVPGELKEIINPDPNKLTSKTQLPFLIQLDEPSFTD